MELRFPPAFIFGTSTSAYQIETAVAHDWLGHIARDGHHFQRTTDHELRYEEDVKLIAGLAPNYRMSLMWSRLQRSAYAPFDPCAKAEYHHLLQQLRASNVGIMMVLHHFANPIWFAKSGGWSDRENINAWVDFAKKAVDEYGAYVDLWNTFNEPNLYTGMAWVAGEFPPYRKNLIAARRVMQNLGEAHRIIYHYIKEKYPDRMVGISHNCVVFAADNFTGRLPAKVFDAVYMEWAARQFTPVDFFGMSYYARIGFDPLPSSYLLTPDKMDRQGKRHDDMWEYYPEGLGQCIQRFWKQYGKPIIITENGICTSDDTQRVNAICDYLSVVHGAISSGVDIRGYYHWTAWDNFEWSLGPSYQFGLCAVDPVTKERTRKPSASVFAGVAFTNTLRLPDIP